MFRHFFHRVFHPGRRGCGLVLIAAMLLSSTIAQACDTQTKSVVKQSVQQTVTQQATVAQPAPQIVVQPRFVQVPMTVTQTVVPMIVQSQQACACSTAQVTQGQAFSQVQVPPPPSAGLFIPQDDPGQFTQAAPCNCQTAQVVSAPAVASVKLGLLQKLRLQHQEARALRESQQALLVASSSAITTSSVTTDTRTRTRLFSRSCL